jgi:hypothetical protein
MRLCRPRSRHRLAYPSPEQSTTARLHCLQNEDNTSELDLFNVKGTIDRHGLIRILLASPMMMGEFNEELVTFSARRFSMRLSLHCYFDGIFRENTANSRSPTLRRIYTPHDNNLYYPRWGKHKRK